MSLGTCPVDGAGPRGQAGGPGGRTCYELGVRRRPVDAEAEER
ncbi:hypothetical protein [Nannocystis pusilla]